MTMKHLLLKPRLLLGLALLACALITSCGGGSQVSKFQPQRVVALGDEYSYLGSDGTRYTVGYSDPQQLSGPYPCANNPVWVQSLAALKFGIAFPGCLGEAPTAAGVMLAAPGNTVQAVINSVAPNSAINWNGFQDGDLVTILAGAHDILAAYNTYVSSGASVAALRTQLKATGTALGQWIYQLSQQHSGIRILVVTVPDLGLSPLAVSEATAHTEPFVSNDLSFYDTCVDPNSNAGSSTHQEVLSRLTACFNSGLRVGLSKADGRYIGLVLGDEMTHQVSENPSAYSFDNANNAACLSTIKFPNCSITVTGTSSTGPQIDSTTDFVVDTASPGNTASRYFWSYDYDSAQPYNSGIWLSPGGHNQLTTRASNQFDVNPF